MTFLGDSHGDLGWTLRAMRASRRHGARLMVQAGDFGIDWPGPEKLRYGDRVQVEAERLGMVLAFVRGNHDCTDSLDSVRPRKGESFTRIREDIWHFDGGVIEWEGWRIGGLGGATSHPEDRAWRLEEEHKRRKPRRLWWPGESVSREATATLAMQDPVDIFVSHDAPLVDGIDLPSRSDEAEYQAEALLDRQLITRTRAKILKPGGLSFCGHWHQRLSAADELGRVEVLGRDSDRDGALVAVNLDTMVITPLRV